MSEQTIARLGSVIAGQLGGWFPGASPYGRWYEQETGAKGFASSAFCAMGLSWAARQAGISTDVIPTFAWTPSGADFYRRQGRWTKGVGGIRRGDIWFSSCAGLGRISHVGWVESVHADGSFTTLEFNTAATINGDQRNGRTVARKRRNTACSLGGYGRPKYEGAAPVLRQPSATQREQLEVLGFADTLAYQNGRGLFPDGDMGPLTTDALQKEYDMALNDLDDKLDQLLARPAISDQRVHEIVAHELARLTGRNPDGSSRAKPVRDEVADAVLKLDYLGLREVHFRREPEGPWCVATIGTNTWMECPDEDTWVRHNGWLDHLGWNRPAEGEKRTYHRVCTWDQLRGVQGGDSVVTNELAPGTQVPWALQPVAPDDVPVGDDTATAGPDVDDEPVVDAPLTTDDEPSPASRG